jgi:glycosyltransferase involved in cell wall biosynthesis
VLAQHVLILQDWYTENDLLNPSLFALLDYFPEAHVGFLKNFAATLPETLAKRHTEFYAARLPRKAFENLEALIKVQSEIPIADYDLVICNTRGYLRHLRREKDARTRIIVYQHDLLPFLWRANAETLSAQKAAELLRLQETDLEYAAGIDDIVAANYALRTTLAAMHRRQIPLAYPLVDHDLFFPDTEAEAEYFVATESEDLENLLHLIACVTDKLVVLREYRPDKLFRELKPDNIFYAGNLTIAEQAYYLAGARAIFCGETRRLEHLPLAALKCGVPVIAHPTQGMHEFLQDGDLGAELETGSADELIRYIRFYRERTTDKLKIAGEVEWLNREYFLRRWRKILEHGQ